MNKSVLPVILTGGFGKRLYPLSNLSCPKQFIKLTENNESFFQNITKKIRKIFKEKLVIICNVKHIKTVQKQLREINEKDYILIVENECKNTFASLLLAIKYCEKNNNIDTIFVSPTDSFIENDNAYIKKIQQSIMQSIEKQKHIIFGIKPTFANINYGYIKTNYNIVDNFYKVDTFIEKPCEKLAEIFIKNQQFLWNNGSFIFNKKKLIEEINQYQQQEINIINKMKLKKYSENYYKTDKYFLKLTNQQIDKAIIEKSHNLLCCKATFNWCDIGSFDILYSLFVKNKIQFYNQNHLLILRNFINSRLQLKSTL